jgi:hypothetical protein
MLRATLAGHRQSDSSGVSIKKWLAAQSARTLDSV